MEHSDNCQHQCHNLTTTMQEILSHHSAQPDSLIPILNEVQRTIGHLHQEAIRQIADFLGLPPSRIYGVASFYSLLATEPKGENVIRVCSSAPCYVVGSADILKEIQNQLSIKPGETTADGKFTLEYTSCIGVCGVAPAVMINDQVYGNLTLDKVKEILNKY